jgi:hypothetical protein
MNIKDFVSHKKFENIDKEIERIERERQNNGFNLFTISSYNTYLENFHSDVIALLLSSKERHLQQERFFKLFLSFLREKYGAIIDENNYQNYQVLREKGKIDIWIKDEISKRCIIIENKINDAIDMPNQIERYYDYVSEKGYLVDGIIYLTLKGNKNAPKVGRKEIDDKIIDIVAFVQDKKNLCNGWLFNCYIEAKERKDDDSSTFIYQYIKLIKHLSLVVMNNELKKDFYEVVSNEQNREKARVLVTLLNELETYRMDLFMEKIGKDYAPFTKIYRYKPYHQLFEGYEEKGIVYKLDVHFYEDKSCLDFWCPNIEEDECTQHISNKLSKMQLLEEFTLGGFGGGMYKWFTIEDYHNIREIDEAVYIFVHNFFVKLRETHNS